MVQIIVILAGTIILVGFSWHSLRTPHYHGVTRFFAWENILILIAIQLPHWFVKPFSWYQLISWSLLCVSLTLALVGFILLNKIGGSKSRTDENTNFPFENTANLVTQSIFKYIRHPLYSSLLCLVWGVFFKLPSLLGGSIAMVATAFLFATAKIEEQENIKTFGRKYVEYMKTTKMFIPFLI